MKRFHVHVGVPDLDRSIRFYSTLFAAEPTVVKPEYAKWMLDDPPINFAISQREQEFGIAHLGLQVDEADELEELGTRLQKAEAAPVPEKNVTCCYARSDKYWAKDPAGVTWESFRSLDAAPQIAGCCGGEQKTACCA